MNEELRQLRIENKLLREEKKQALQDNEQCRLQMAGISTAAIGYWKEGDGIHSDYDTPALRDVAKLYAKYDRLYKRQNVIHGVIAGALFDFMGWLTSRPKRIMLGSSDEASPAVDAIKDFAKMRGLSLDDARVQNWQAALAQPEEKPLHPVHIGVDVTKEGTAVTAFYRKPDAVMEMFYSQFHPLTQPEQEPCTKVECMGSNGCIGNCWNKKQPQQELVCVCGAVWEGEELIYTPPQRKPLTDEQIEAVWRNVQTNDFHDCVQPFARAIEDAYGIKE